MHKNLTRVNPVMSKYGKNVLFIERNGRGRARKGKRGTSARGRTLAHREHRTHYETSPSTAGENIQRRQRDSAGMRDGVHLLHNKRGEVSSWAN